MKFESQIRVKNSSKTYQRFHKIAMFMGVLGLSFSAFLACVYYAHILALPDAPIETVRYLASTHTLAVSLFFLSFSLDLIALLNRNSATSFKFMLASAATAFAGYIPPCTRLWELKYIDFLNQTIVIMVTHMFSILMSAALLRLSCKHLTESFSQNSSLLKS